MPGARNGVSASTLKAGTGPARPRIWCRIPGACAAMCCTTQIGVEKSGGKSATTVRKASAPPDEVPMTMTRCDEIARSDPGMAMWLALRWPRRLYTLALFALACLVLVRRCRVELTAAAIALYRPARPVEFGATASGRACQTVEIDDRRRVRYHVRHHPVVPLVCHVIKAWTFWATPP